MVVILKLPAKKKRKKIVIAWIEESWNQHGCSFQVVSPWSMPLHSGTCRNVGRRLLAFIPFTYDFEQTSQDNQPTVSKSSIDYFNRTWRRSLSKLKRFITMFMRQMGVIWVVPFLLKQSVTNFVLWRGHTVAFPTVKIQYVTPLQSVYDVSNELCIGEKTHGLHASL